MVYPKKGEIYLINFDPTIGHETKKKRPAIILSNDIHNQYSPLVTVAPISSNVNNIYPFEIYLPEGMANLDNDSKIMIIQLRSVDKKRLLKKIGSVNNKQINMKINNIIAEHFSL
ncbi:MAG: type II toxin-antitoxin system PemK/MazF family toxin [Atribacterota bacterium]|jgi:mRNA interferase MazF|nr:type II toxin-antitoxin system PemK/MazF family toxin [Atribacterota bacterium]